MQLLLGDARAAPRLLMPCLAPLFLTQQQERAFFTQQERTFLPSYSCHPSPSDARTLLPCCLHPSSFLLSVFFGAASPVSLSLSLSDGASSNNSDSEAEEDVGVDDMQTFEPGALPAAKAADKEVMEEEEEGGGGTGGALGETGGTATSTNAQDKESSSDEFEDDDMDKY
jgi:hypothetical protein